MCFNEKVGDLKIAMNSNLPFAILAGKFPCLRFLDLVTWKQIEDLDVCM